MIMKQLLQDCFLRRFNIPRRKKQYRRLLTVESSIRSKYKNLESSSSDGDFLLFEEKEVILCQTTPIVMTEKQIRNGLH